MSVASFQSFLRDEDGGYTVWSVCWFLLYCALGGLAVDVGDAMRNQSLLQSTADAAALAGVMSLPDTSDAVAQALAYATDNMSPSQNGQVLKDTEVFTGNWNGSVFTNNGTPLNAVAVITRRGDENANPLGTKFLRIIGLDSWNIATTAIAVVYVPGCADDGLLAGGHVFVSSNNDFVKDFCIHGQDGVKIQSNNSFEDGVNVSMGDLDTLQIPNSGFDSNEGLADALQEGDLYPQDAYIVDEIIQNLLGANQIDYLPDYVLNADKTALLNGKVEPVSSKFDFSTFVPGTVYHVECAPNKNLVLPNNTEIYNIVIVADCNISGGQSSYLHDVVLASASTGNGQDPYAQDSISLSASIILGEDDECASGGGVRMYSAASVHTASGTIINGTQIIARGNVDLTAANDGVLGVAVQAGGDISLTSNNVMGLCSGGSDVDNPSKWYRLAR